MCIWRLAVPIPCCIHRVIFMVSCFACDPDGCTSCVTLGATDGARGGDGGSAGCSERETFLPLDAGRTGSGSSGTSSNSGLRSFKRKVPWPRSRGGGGGGTDGGLGTCGRCSRACGAAPPFSCMRSCCSFFAKPLAFSHARGCCCDFSDILFQNWYCKQATDVHLCCARPDSCFVKGLPQCSQGGHSSSGSRPS